MGGGEDRTQHDEDVRPRQRGGERAVRVLEQCKGGRGPSLPLAQAIGKPVPVRGDEDHLRAGEQPLHQKAKSDEENKGHGSGFPFRFVVHTDLDDPDPLDPLYGKPKGAEKDRVALPGKPAELVEEQARHRVPLLVGETRREGVVEPVDRHLPENAPGSVRPGQQLLFLPVVLLPDLPEELLEHVLQRHDPDDLPKLVDDEREVHLEPLELPQQEGQLLRGGNDERRLEQGGERRIPLPVRHRAQQILQVEDADDLFSIPLIDGYPRAAVLSGQRQKLLARDVDGYHEHIGKRGHDLARPLIGQLEDVVDELPLPRGEAPRPPLPRPQAPPPPPSTRPRTPRSVSPHFLSTILPPPSRRRIPSATFSMRNRTGEMMREKRRNGLAARREKDLALGHTMHLEVMSQIRIPRVPAESATISPCAGTIGIRRAASREEMETLASSLPMKIVAISRLGVSSIFPITPATRFPSFFHFMKSTRRSAKNAVSVAEKKADARKRRGRRSNFMERSLPRALRSPARGGGSPPSVTRRPAGGARRRHASP